MPINSKTKQDQELWKPIKGYSFYEVSNLGNVRSVDRFDSLKRFRNGTELKKYKSREGYYRVNLYKNGVGKSHQIHQLVAENFLNHKRNYYSSVVDHINNIKTDNRVSNLQILTNRENSNKKPKGVSKYIGVSVLGKKWRANIRINGKLVYLGSYDKEYDAHLAYQNKLNQLKYAN